MVHRFVCCVAAALALSFAGVAGAQERVALKPLFKPGQDLVYPLALRVTVDQTIVDKAVKQWALVCSTTLVMRIETVKEDGSITATGRFKRGELRLTGDDVNVGYAWGPSSQQDPAWGATATLAEPLEAAKITIDVDEHGQAIVTDGLQAFLEKYHEVGSGDDRLLGLFAPEKLGETLTPIFDLDGAGDEPMSVGGGWKVSEITPMPGAGDLKMDVDMSLLRLEPHEAEYFGDPRFELTMAPEVVSDGVQVTLVRGSGGIGGIYDLSARMLRQRKETLTLQTQWRSEEAHIIQQQSSITYLQLGEQKR